MKRVECLRACGGREVQRVSCAETKQEECARACYVPFFFLKIESREKKSREEARKRGTGKEATPLIELSSSFKMKKN